MALRTVASRSETSFFRARGRPEVERQHEQDEGVEGDPKQRLKGHGDSWPATTALVNQLHCFPDYVSGDFETTGTEFVDGSCVV